MAEARARLEKQGYWRSPEARNRQDQVPISARIGRGTRLSAGAIVELTRTIEAEIIPRLVMAHRTPHPNLSIATLGSADLAPDDIAELAEQTLDDDVDGLCVRIEALRTSGLSLEDIFVRLLTPAASYLHHLWSNDLCGVAEFTLALWRLQQLLRQYSIEFRSDGARQETGHRALLLPAPGGRHELVFVTFGLVMMSEFLRRDGWETRIESDTASPEFSEVIRSERFDVVEFLVRGDKSLDALASRIRLIRRDSPNRSIGVMVCGQVFFEHPEFVVQVGADVAAPEARQGALQAQRLVHMIARRSQMR
jgi:MerR family transcriptional regulator, light-induced transcriptional regulator